MKRLILYTLLSFFLVGCSNNVVIVDEEGAYSSSEYSTFIDEKLEEIYQTNSSEAIQLLDHLNTDLILIPYQIQDKTLLTRSIAGYSLLELSMLYHYNEITFFILKNIDRSKYKIDLLKTAIDTSNEPVLIYILDNHLQDLKQMNYIEYAIKNGKLLLAYEIFQRQYLDPSKNDYHIATQKLFKDHILSIKGFSYSCCTFNRKNIEKKVKNKLYKRFLLAIYQNGKKDFLYHCARKSYFGLKKFIKQYPTYKSRKLKKELEILFRRDAMQDYATAKEFLRLRAKDPLAKKVKARLDYLEFKDVYESDSIHKIKAYLKTHHRSKYRTKLKKKLAYLIFKKAYDSNSIEEAQNYLKTHPHSKYKMKMKEHLHYLYFLKAKESESITQLKNYIKKFPNSPYIYDAKREIYKLNKQYAVKRLADRFLCCFDTASWDGNYDNDSGTPYGHGTLTIEDEIKYENHIFFFDSYIVVVELKGKVKSNSFQPNQLILKYYRKSTGLLGGSATLLKKASYSVNTASEAKHYIKGYIDYLKNPSNNSSSKCQKLYKKCLSYCDHKSNSNGGLLSMSDRESCISSCQNARRACQNSDNIKARVSACFGMCEGVDNTKTSFPIFGSTQHEKCVNRCEIELKNQGF